MDTTHDSSGTAIPDGGDERSEWTRLTAADKRARIIDAAVAVFSEQGLEAPMHLVAERAGAGVASIYRLFESKHDLFAAIVIRRYAELTAAFEAVDGRLEQAARVLGVSEWGVLWRVTLPLAWRGILAGVLLAFARAMGEFGATITFVSNIPGETQTLPSAIYTFTQVPGGETGALRLTLVSVAIAMAALVASEAFARRIDRRLTVE